MSKVQSARLKVSMVLGRGRIEGTLCTGLWHCEQEFLVSPLEGLMRILGGCVVVVPLHRNGAGVTVLLT